MATTQKIIDDVQRPCLQDFDVFVRKLARRARHEIRRTVQVCLQSRNGDHVHCIKAPDHRWLPTWSVMEGSLGSLDSSYCSKDEHEDLKGLQNRGDTCAALLTIPVTEPCPGIGFPRCL
jgi:hypothetical protein